MMLYDASVSVCLILSSPPNSENKLSTLFSARNNSIHFVRLLIMVRNGFLQIVMCPWIRKHILRTKYVRYLLVLCSSTRYLIKTRVNYVEIRNSYLYAKKRVSTYN